MLRRVVSYGRTVSHGAAMARGRRAVDRAYGRCGPLPSAAEGPAILADGMWDNPNHFFRLRLFLSAIPDLAAHRLLAVLRSRGDRARRTLERLGFRHFVFRDDLSAAEFVPLADRLLRQVRSHWDLLALTLPEGLPAYVFYDTALKQARHPQPPLDHPIWRRALAEQLRDAALARRVFESWPVKATVLSHPWKSEYAALIWTSLARGIPAFHLTGYCEAIRIRRFTSPADYFVPVEHMTAADFERLPAAVRTALVEEGRAYLRQREAGGQTDINARMAYRPGMRLSERAAARAQVGGDATRPIALVASHVWFDFPHTFGMRNFTDFLDWMRVTVETVRAIPEVTWVLKAHPTEPWYGGFRLADIATDLPQHLKLLPPDFDAATALIAADAVVTVHGTMAIEAAARGLPVIAGDRSSYSGWGFTHEAAARDDYLALLRRVTSLPAPSAEGRARAAACAALTLATMPSDLGLLDMRCDSSGPVLCHDIVRRIGTREPAVERERRAIARWLASDSSSYAIFNRVERLRSLASEAVAA